MFNLLRNLKIRIENWNANRIQNLDRSNRYAQIAEDYNLK